MKTITLAITYRVELEVDERVTDEDIDWAVNQRIREWSDGRQPFSTEIMAHGFVECAKSFLTSIRCSLASTIADKYPGARNRMASDGWSYSSHVEKRLPEFKFARCSIGPEVTVIDGDKVRIWDDGFLP